MKLHAVLNPTPESLERLRELTRDVRVLTDVHGNDWFELLPSKESPSGFALERNPMEWFAGGSTTTSYVQSGMLIDVTSDDISFLKDHGVTLERHASCDTPQALLEEAVGIMEERAASYGPVVESYRRITSAFNALRGHKLSPVDGLYFMRLVKMDRERTSPELNDHYVDGAVYGVLTTLFRDDETLVF